MNLFKIEDVAKQSGLTKRTIRYYEEIGLLFPPDRSDGGFRLYSEKHIERLKQITNARDVLGISLQELQEYVSINEQFQAQREGFRQIEDKELKLVKIVEIEQTIGQQLLMIDQKLEKLTEIRKEFSDLFDRILEAKSKIKLNQE
jgi:MerR family transcriptional regulator, repressor of the yfmOP operon